MAPGRVKDGDGATIMPPLVVGDDIGGRIPQGQRPRSHRDREFTAMRAKLAALLRVARGGRVAQGQFQAQCRVEVSGFEGREPNTASCLAGFSVSMWTPIWASRSEGILGQQPTSAPHAPWFKWHHLMRHGGTSSWGSPSRFATCWRCAVEALSSETVSISSSAMFGSLGAPFL